MHSRRLLEYIAFGPENSLEVNYDVPRRPGSVSTEFRLDDLGRPKAYRRVRKLPDGRPFEQLVAYVKPGASSQLMRSIKSTESSEIQQFVRRTAAYMAPVLSGYQFDAVMPVPSSKPLARSYAQELAARLGNLPLLDPATKLKPMTKVGVSQRMAQSMELFHADYQSNLKGNILLVDDYITSGASLTALAAKLYAVKNRAGESTVNLVVGTAIAI